MRRLAITGLMGLSVAGCATDGTATAVRRDHTPLPNSYAFAAGLDRVIGRDAQALVTLFGKADADVSEGAGHKLQFVGAACVLDAYLYPKGAGAPVVTYVDSRQPDGSPIDKASCVAALSRRDGGK